MKILEGIKNWFGGIRRYSVPVHLHKLVVLVDNNRPSDNNDDDEVVISEVGYGAFAFFVEHQCIDTLRAFLEERANQFCLIEKKHQEEGRNSDGLAAMLKAFGLVGPKYWNLEINGCKFDLNKFVYAIYNEDYDDSDENAEEMLWIFPKFKIISLESFYESCKLCNMPLAVDVSNIKKVRK